MLPTTATTYQVYLGRNVPTPQLGHEATCRVSDDMFDRFIRDNVVPRFQSFSVTNSSGYWKGEREDVSIITIISEHYFDAIDVHKIAKEYCQQFDQEAVFINSLSSFPSLITHD
jgi:hypothetical protein